jgi:hypothetical protein
VHDAQAVREPAVLRALEHDEGESELTDATQALKFGPVYEVGEQSVAGTSFIKRNDVVNRISVTSLTHGAFAFISAALNLT